jgi:hypothetical protein
VIKEVKMKMKSKVKAAGVGAGITTILATALVSILASFGVVLPLEVAVGIVGAIVTLVSVIAGYYRIERVPG